MADERNKQIHPYVKQLADEEAVRILKELRGYVQEALERMANGEKIQASYNDSEPGVLDDLRKQERDLQRRACERNTPKPVTKEHFIELERQSREDALRDIENLIKREQK